MWVIGRPTSVSPPANAVTGIAGAAGTTAGYHLVRSFRRCLRVIVRSKDDRARLTALSQTLGEWASGVVTRSHVEKVRRCRFTRITRPLPNPGRD